MSANICEFCGKSFSSLCNLKNHIRKTKYCLELRGENIEEQPYVCEYCNSGFLRKFSLERHIEICAEHKNSIVENEKNKMIELQDEVKRLTKLTKNLQSQLSKQKSINQKLDYKNKGLGIKVKKLVKDHDVILKEKDERILELEKQLMYEKGMVYCYKENPNKVTNNVNYIGNKLVNQKLSSIQIDNIRPLNKETIDDYIQDYTYKLYLQGEKGVIKYIQDMVLLDVDGVVEQNYASTNKNDNNFYRLPDENKIWEHDGKAKYIYEVLDSLSEISMEHYELLNYNLRQAIKNRTEDAEKLGRLATNLLNFHIGLTNKDSKERTNLHRKIITGIRPTLYIGDANSNS